MRVKRGVAVVTYNRKRKLKEIVDAVRDTMPTDCRLVVCDDGSTDGTHTLANSLEANFITGRNLGVGANKNRALFALQDCHFIALIEDDLLPTDSGWFETYEEVAQKTDIHHFCRVQDKTVAESMPGFTEWMKSSTGLTPVYGLSPRGDFTFLTAKVLSKVGAFNPAFKGCGYAHGDWSNRVVDAGLVPHPLKWIDIQEARDRFIQVGDTEGGRWDDDKDKIKSQINKNKRVAARAGEQNRLYHPLVFP